VIGFVEDEGEVGVFLRDLVALFGLELLQLVQIAHQPVVPRLPALQLLLLRLRHALPQLQLKRVLVHRLQIWE